MQIIIRILFIVAGFIASWFVAKDALNYDIVTMLIAVCLVTLVVAVAAFWPYILQWIRKTRKRK